MGKWIGILIAVVVLSAVGYGIYRWTDLPEQGQEWMEEQDLKNFPTQARRELKDMKEELAEMKKQKHDLEIDIIKREGREDWSKEQLSAEGKNGLACLVWYNSEVEKYEKAIEDIVAQVKLEQTKLRDAGVIDAATGDVPDDHEYTITAANGSERKWTLAKAKTETDKIADLMSDAKKKRDRQQRIVERKKDALAKYTELVAKKERQIEEMEEFIEDMEAELEMLAIEEELAEINASLNGENDENRFGVMVRKFRDKQKEFKAEQELRDAAAGDDDGYFAKESEESSSGSSAGYWD